MVCCHEPALVFKAREMQDEDFIVLQAHIKMNLLSERVLYEFDLFALSPSISLHTVSVLCFNLLFRSLHAWVVHAAFQRYTQVKWTLSLVLHAHITSSEIVSLLEKEIYSKWKSSQRVKDHQHRFKVFQSLVRMISGRVCCRTFDVWARPCWWLWQLRCTKKPKCKTKRWIGKDSRFFESCHRWFLWQKNRR